MEKGVCPMESGIYLNVVSVRIILAEKKKIGTRKYFKHIEKLRPELFKLLERHF